MSSRTTVAALPAYRALLVVDIENFSVLKGREHPGITNAIPVIIRAAFRRCDLPFSLVDEVEFDKSDGDSHVFGFRSMVLPYLLNPFLTKLQEELEQQAEADPHRDFRMRVSVNVGPMTDPDAANYSDFSGSSRVENHRLNNAQPVRDLLIRSERATRVAAIVSARAYEDAVEQGYTAEDPKGYVRAPVEVKTYENFAYLRVPNPTGELLTNGLWRNPKEAADDKSATKEAAKAQASPPSTTVSNQAGNVGGNSTQAGKLNSNVNVTTNNGGNNIGSIGSVGTFVQEASGPVNG
jgi:hypothetical protein